MGCSRTQDGTGRQTEVEDALFPPAATLFKLSEILGVDPLPQQLET